MRSTNPRRVAIVVPSFGRPEQVRSCLRVLGGLEGGPYPTVVVDDGSPVPLESICRDAGDWVRCHRQENAGPAAARNAGAALAEDAEFLLFTDDDCAPRKDWAKRLLAAQGGVSGRLVGGRIENALEANVYSAASQSLSGFLYHHYLTTGSGMSFFTTNNMCCRRQDFLDRGGFDASFTFASEDRDFSLRWKASGGTLEYCADAVVDHAHALNLRKFWRQHRSYGRGARRLHRALDARGDDRPKVEKASFYLGMLLWPLRRPGRARLAQSFLVGLSQVAMVQGYLDAVRAERKIERG